MGNCLLEMKGIKKYFPGIKALDGVDYTIRAGEVHALIGENGAGKSTLVKVLTGIYHPEEGKIIIQGVEVDFKNPLDSQKASIAAIHQEATMFPDLSVTENIYMGHHLKKPFPRTIDWKEMKHKTKVLLEKLELDINPDTKVKNLSVAQRHMVEIVKALSLDARIVIMDEPTSALSLKEVEDLYRIIRQLKSEGKAIVFISHKFEDIFEIADYFTVLRDGKYIGQGRVADTDVDAIIQMMVGRSLNKMFPKRAVEHGNTVLEVKRISRVGIFKDISFKLHKGEILGLFGLVGAGRSDVIQAIFGIDLKTEGEVFINGKIAEIKNPAEAMNYGIAYIPEDRQLQGTIAKMNIRENLTLPIIDKISRYSFLDSAEELKITQKFGRRMDIKASGWEQPVNDLSGGNQQKVVLAKWLATRPEILIMDEPTKGIDVATKARVHEFISVLAKQGMAILLISSEIPEILCMSDKIVVMYEGTVTGRFNRDEADSEKLLKAATGSIFN